MCYLLNWDIWVKKAGQKLSEWMKREEGRKESKRTSADKVLPTLASQRSHHHLPLVGWQMMPWLLLTEKRPPGSEARRFGEGSQPREASHTSLVSTQVVEVSDLFQAPLQKVPWQLELCWQVPLKGKACVMQERWNMFHCHPPHRINGCLRIFLSATFPYGEGGGRATESWVWCYKSP